MSTDDTGIAAAARGAGAEIVERPAELAGDDASSESALLHALDVLEGRGEALPEIVVMVQCTSPFIAAADIDGVLELVDSGGGLRVHGDSHPRVPVAPSDDGAAAGVNHDARSRPRRQDRDAGVRWRPARSTRCAPPASGRRATGSSDASRSTRFPRPARSRSTSRPTSRWPRRSPRGVHEGRRTPQGSPSRSLAVVFDFDGVLTDNRVMTLARTAPRR